MLFSQQAILPIAICSIHIPLHILILEGAEFFDNLVAGGGGVQVHLLPDFVEFHNVQHLEADAVDE